MLSDRFVVTELEGYATMRKGAGRWPPGISCHVVDTLWNRRVMASYRSEDRVGMIGRHGGSTTLGRTGARQRAVNRAEYLNAVHQGEDVEAAREREA